MLSLINLGFKYVMDTSARFKIDESHALKHSMEVYEFAKRIYESEVGGSPYLNKQIKIIYMAAIGHDMCDKKYVADEAEGIEMYKNHLKENMDPGDLDTMGKIIGTMSYSKVKVSGYPNLGEYQLAYHIVREADLLAAYDIDRCVIYSMYKEQLEYGAALKTALDLFDSRVFRMRHERLFRLKYSQAESLKLHKKAFLRISTFSRN